MNGRSAPPATGDTAITNPNTTAAATGLALVRVTIGAMFIWVFFENLGKGLYTPAGYAGLIHYYIEKGHSPVRGRP